MTHPVDGGAAARRSSTGPARRAWTGVLVASALVGGALPAQAQALDVQVHDPVMIEADGRYWLFATGRGVSVWSSADRRSWTREPAVFDETPAWVTEMIPEFRGGMWAPDIAFHDGRYHLFYSVSRFGRNTSAIGHASTPTLDPADPSFGWEDHGPVVRSVPGRDDWNAIDPNLVVDDEGTPWLTFGSYFGGLKLVRLAPDLNGPASPQTWRTVASRHRYWKLDERDAGDPMNAALEAPFIFRRDGWYYLFVSWDRCCAGAESTYKVVAGRARDVTGPYLDREGVDLRLGGGTLVVAGNEAWPGVGHNSAYTFDGTDYLVFHGYDVSDEGRSKLWIEEIDWDEHGWPQVSLR